MSRKRSPLSRLLRLREIREKAERIELARTQRAEIEAAEREAIAKAAEADFIQPLDLMRPAQLRAMQLMGVRLHEIREAAATDHEEAQRRLDDQRESWRKSAVDLDGAEALDEKRNRVAATLARAAAERALDDIQIVRRGRKVSK